MPVKVVEAGVYEDLGDVAFAKEPERHAELRILLWLTLSGEAGYKAGRLLAVAARVDIIDEIKHGISHLCTEPAVGRCRKARYKKGLPCLGRTEKAKCRCSPRYAQHPVRLVLDAVELLDPVVSLIVNLLNMPGAVYPADGSGRLLADCAPGLPESCAPVF